MPRMPAPMTIRDIKDAPTRGWRWLKRQRRCQDTSRVRNMEVRFLPVHPKNLDETYKRTAYQRVPLCESSEDSEGITSETDRSFSSPDSGSPARQADPWQFPVGPRALPSPLPSKPTSGRRSAPPSLPLFSLLPPLPRTALCGTQEPWEKEMVRLPARLYFMDAARKAAALSSSFTFCNGTSSAGANVSNGKSGASKGKHHVSTTDDNGGWRERCSGDVKLLRADRRPRSVRVLMRRQDKTRAPCANHLVTIDMELRPAASAGFTSAGERAWVYHVLADYAEGCPESRVIALLFQSGRAARRWRAKFDEAKHLLETECDA